MTLANGRLELVIDPVGTKETRTTMLLHNSKLFEQNGLLLQGKLVLLSDIIVCRHRSVSLNNEKICREISEDKIAVCEKTAGL